jgi:hypothetical protein
MNPGETSDEGVKQGKKRGRKPKGGKIIQQLNLTTPQVFSKPNIILHLKCSMKDIDPGACSGSEVESYNVANLMYEIIDKKEDAIYTPELAPTSTTTSASVDKDQKTIYNKLQELSFNLHSNSMFDKKSACFWCSSDFDSLSIHIPKSCIKGSYEVYGCFCSPECATGYLMREPIDSSTRFERYALLNHIYAGVYNYTKNIKPAPNPYYMLDKYYGNLTIQEYRALLKSERLFLTIDKPMSKILPEIHEDNEEFIINNKIIPSKRVIPLKKPTITFS